MKSITVLKTVIYMIIIMLNKDNCVASCSVNLSNTWLPLLEHEVQIGVVGVIKKIYSNFSSSIILKKHR